MAEQAGTSLWSGVAAQAFAESVHVIPFDLEELVTAHQDAVFALHDYAGTLNALQQQAIQVLGRAQNAQIEANSASNALAAAEARYGSANEEYWLYYGKVNLFESEKTVADAVGNHTEAARLSAEIVAATQSRNAAWIERNQASADIKSATSTRNAAQNQVASEQANARRNHKRAY